MKSQAKEIEIIKNLLSDFSEIFWVKPDMFFNESDIQSELYSKLRRNFGRETQFDNVFVYGTDKPKKHRKIPTQRLHSELLLPEGRIDLAILDLENTYLALNSRGKYGGLRIYDGQHIFFEIKASQTSRSRISSKNQWKKSIIKDIEKLNKYKHQCYSLCFDFSGLLEEHEIESMKESANINVEVLYFTTKHKSRYFV